MSVVKKGNEYYAVIYYRDEFNVARRKWIKAGTSYKNAERIEREFRADLMVYVTDGDKNFHRSGCGLLYGKQITGIALGKAYQEGYSPCGQCEPPQIKRDYWSQVEETNWGTLCPPLRPTRRDKLFPEMQHHFRDFAKMIRTGYIV